MLSMRLKKSAFDSALLVSAASPGALPDALDALPAGGSPSSSSFPGRCGGVPLLGEDAIAVGPWARGTATAGSSSAGGSSAQGLPGLSGQRHTLLLVDRFLTK